MAIVLSITAMAVVSLKTGDRATPPEAVAQAGEPAALGKAELDKALQAFTAKANLQVKDQFEIEKGIRVVSYTTDNGMRGGVFYAFPDGTFMAGQRYDALGELQTDDHFRKAWPDGPPTPETAADLPAATQALAQAKIVSRVKPGKPEIYMVYEPNCGFCQRSYPMLRDIDATVHFLPVSFLAPESEALVAAMLSGEKNIMDTVQDRSKYPALIEKYQSKVAEIRPQIEKNAQVMRLAGIQGTPAYFFVGKNGIERVERGAMDPERLRALVAQAGQAQGIAVADARPGPR